MPLTGALLQIYSVDFTFVHKRKNYDIGKYNWPPDFAEFIECF